MNGPLGGGRRCESCSKVCQAVFSSPLFYDKNQLSLVDETLQEGIYDLCRVFLLKDLSLG